MSECCICPFSFSCFAVLTILSNQSPFPSLRTDHITSRWESDGLLNPHVMSLGHLILNTILPPTPATTYHMFMCKVFPLRFSFPSYSLFSLTHLLLPVPSLLPSPFPAAQWRSQCPGLWDTFSLESTTFLSSKNIV